MQAEKQETQATAPCNNAVEKAASVEQLLTQAGLYLAAPRCNINVDVARGLVLEAHRLAGELAEMLRRTP